MPDVLGLAVLGETCQAELAPVARSSEPAPLRLREVGAEVVDPDRSVPEGAGDPLGAGGVGGPDRTGEPVVGVVAERDRLVLAREALDGLKRQMAEMQARLEALSRK